MGTREAGAGEKFRDNLFLSPTLTNKLTSPRPAPGIPTGARRHRPSKSRINHELPLHCTASREGLVDSDLDLVRFLAQGPPHQAHVRLLLKTPQTDSTGLLGVRPGHAPLNR